MWRSSASGHHLDALHADFDDLPPLDSLPMRVPPARILFPPEDRVAILERIDDALASGPLTLGPIGAELEAALQLGSTRSRMRIWVPYKLNLQR